jgi:hypothetical protein
MMACTDIPIQADNTNLIELVAAGPDKAQLPIICVMPASVSRRGIFPVGFVIPLVFRFHDPTGTAGCYCGG